MGKLFTTLFILQLFLACGGENTHLDKNSSSSSSSQGNTKIISSLEGSISDYLKKIQFGTEDDNLWISPTLSEQNQLSDILIDILNKRYFEAHEKALTLGGKVIKFIDANKEYYILHLSLENLENNSFISKGGTYVFYPSGKNYAIQVPHPTFDTNTNLEGIEAYLELESKYLLISGTHRKSSNITSSCQSTYRESDASHNDKHYFFNVHKILSQNDSNTIFIEFHGFGTSTRKKLWSQCDNNQNINLINLSEAIDDLNSSSFMYLLNQEITNNTDIKSCIYSPSKNIDANDIYTSSLGGTKNTVGRFTNGTTDICKKSATNSSHRFIHIEQSFEVRRDRRETVIKALKTVQAKFFIR